MFFLHLYYVFMRYDEQKVNEQQAQSNKQRINSNEKWGKGNEQRAKNNKQQAKSNEQGAESNKQWKRNVAFSGFSIFFSSTSFPDIGEISTKYILQTIKQLKQFSYFLL